MVMNLTSTASALALKETLKKPKCKSPLDSLREILKTLWGLLVKLLEILESIEEGISIACLILAFGAVFGR